MTEVPEVPIPKPSEVGPLVKGRATKVEGMSVGFERITPAIATNWLEHNSPNRNIRDRTVQAIVRDILNGDFQPTHQGVAFDSNGELVDGQHRLWAVVRSGQTVIMQVTRGLPPEAKPVIDTGIKRTMADVLQFGGYQNRMVAASIIRMHLQYVRGMPISAYNSAVTQSEQVHHFEENEEAIDEAARLASTWKNHLDATPQVIGTAWLIFSDIDAEQAAQFFDDMLNMTTGGEGDPRLALMRRLRTKTEKKENILPALVLSMFVRAWNAWRNGTPMMKMPVDRLKTKKVLEAI